MSKEKKIPTNVPEAAPTPAVSPGLPPGQFYTMGELTRGVVTVEVNQMAEVVGSGLDTSDPKRTVTSFWLKDGRCLASVDPWLQHLEAEKQKAIQSRTPAV